LPNALWRGLGRVRGFEGLDLLGEFGRARPFLFVWLMSRGGNARHKLITQVGSENLGIVKDALPRRLEIAKLRFGIGKVLLDARVFGAVSVC
jgi:hypothetical protein